MLLELWINEGYANPDLVLHFSVQAMETESDMIKRIIDVIKGYCTDNGIGYDRVSWELTH